MVSNGHISQNEEGVRVVCSNKEYLGSHILIAAGRQPNIKRLNLSKAAVEHTEKGIKVDNRLRTNFKNIFYCAE